MQCDAPTAPQNNFAHDYRATPLNFAQSEKMVGVDEWFSTEMINLDWLDIEL